MGRKKLGDRPCPHPDCFHCPYPDCIKDAIFEPGRKKGPSPAATSKPRKEKTEEQKARIRQQSAAWKKANPEKVQAGHAAYRERHRKEINARNLARYHAKKAGERRALDEQQKHLPDSQAGQRPDTGTGS